MDVLSQYQESQRQNQELMLRKAQLRLNQQQAMQAADEQEFRQVVTALNPKFGMTPEQQAEIINTSGIPKKFHFPGPITPEALAPFHNIVTEMRDIVEGRRKGNVADYQPILQNFLANPSYFHMADQPVLMQAADQLKNEQITKLTAAPTEVQQARERLNQYGPMLALANQNDWADNYQTFANRELEAQRKIDPNANAVDITEDTYNQARLSARSPSVLVDQLRKDQATHELDLMQTQERDRLRFFLKNTPGAVEKAMEGKLAEAGYGSDPVQAVSMQVYQIMKKDPSERTPKEQKMVEAAVPILPAHTAEQLGFLTARQEQRMAKDEAQTVQGRSAVIGQILSGDSEETGAVQKLAQERQRQRTALAGSPKLTDDQHADSIKQAQDYLTMFQGSEAAYRQKAAPQVEYYQALIKKNDEAMAALKTRIASAPSTQLAGLRERLTDLDGERAANQAGMRLLTEHNPYELEMLRSSLDGLTMQRDAAKAAGKTEEADKLTAEIAATEATVTQLDAGRKADLAKVGGYRLSLMERTKALNAKISSLDYRMDKEGKLGMATTMAMKLIGQPDPASPQKPISLTRAMELSSDYTGADKGELTKKLVEIGKLDVPRAQQDLDAAVEAWQVSHPGQYPDQPTIIGLTSKIAKKYPGVAREDIMKGAEVKGPLVSINTNQTASEEAQKKFMDSSRTTYDQLKSAPVLLRNIDEAKALIPQAKGFMGTGGETMLEAAKFLNNRLGTKIATAGIKGAEELRSRIFFNIMDNLKKMDAQPSQMQQQIMQDALGKLGTDPNALSSVLDAYADTIRDKVELYNMEVEGAITRGTKFPYDPRIKVPQPAAPPGAATGWKMQPSGGWTIMPVQK